MWCRSGLVVDNRGTGVKQGGTRLSGRGSGPSLGFKGLSRLIRRANDVFLRTCPLVVMQHLLLGCKPSLGIVGCLSGCL
jgi:hypothetical protein